MDFKEICPKSRRAFRNERRCRLISDLKNLQLFPIHMQPAFEELRTIQLHLVQYGKRPQRGHCRRLRSRDRRSCLTKSRYWFKVRLAAKRQKNLRRQQVEDSAERDAKVTSKAVGAAPFPIDTRCDGRGTESVPGEERTTKVFLGPCAVGRSRIKYSSEALHQIGSAMRDRGINVLSYSPSRTAFGIKASQTDVPMEATVSGEPSERGGIAGTGTATNAAFPEVPHRRLNPFASAEEERLLAQARALSAPPSLEMRLRQIEDPLFESPPRCSSKVAKLKTKPLFPQKLPPACIFPSASGI